MAHTYEKKNKTKLYSEDFEKEGKHKNIKKLKKPKNKKIYFENDED